MSTKHTQGRLAINGTLIESEGDHGWANDGCAVAICEGPDSEDNARRLVACWNVSQGFTTEHLENTLMLGETHRRLFKARGVIEKELEAQIAEMTRQRDALLEAAESLIREHDAVFAGRNDGAQDSYYNAHPGRAIAYRNARAVIASVKGAE